jgi:hypothetical protein
MENRSRQDGSLLHESIAQSHNRFDLPPGVAQFSSQPAHVYID